MYLKKKKAGVDELKNADYNQCTLELEELKNIPVKARTTVETKRYNQLMYKNRKASQAESIGNNEQEEIRFANHMHESNHQCDLTLEQLKELKRQQRRGLEQTMMALAQRFCLECEERELQVEIPECGHRVCLPCALVGSERRCPRCGVKYKEYKELQ